MPNNKSPITGSTMHATRTMSGLRFPQTILNLLAANRTVVASTYEELAQVHAI